MNNRVHHYNFFIVAPVNLTHLQLIAELQRPTCLNHLRFLYLVDHMHMACQERCGNYLLMLLQQQKTNQLKHTVGTAWLQVVERTVNGPQVAKHYHQGKAAPHVQYCDVHGVLRPIIQ